MNLIAHRGLWNEKVLPNSIAALHNGLDSDKYIGVECDIRETKDHKFIIYHNILYKGNLVKTLYYKDMNVPLLEELLSINTNKILLLEIKDFNLNISGFLKKLDKYKRNIYIMSFDKKIIYKIKEYTNKYKLGVLNYILNSDSDYNLDFICLLDILATDNIIKNFKKKNIAVIIYGTMNLKKNLTYIIDDCKI